MWYLGANHSYMKTLKLNFVLLIAAAVLVAVPMSAQLSLKVGLGGQTSVIALNSSQFNTSAGLGTHFNTTVQYGNRFYVESGLQLFNSAQKIEAVRTVANPNPPVNSARLVGMNVPLMLGFHLLGSDAKVNVHVFAGGNLRTILAERSKSDYSQSDFQFMHIGALLGAGATFSIFYGELAYDFGLSNVFKDELFPVGTDIIDSRHNLLRLTLGVHLFRNR